MSGAGTMTLITLEHPQNERWNIYKYDARTSTHSTLEHPQIKRGNNDILALEHLLKVFLNIDNLSAGTMMQWRWNIFSRCIGTAT